MDTIYIYVDRYIYMNIYLYIYEYIYMNIYIYIHMMHVIRIVCLTTWYPRIP